VSDMECPHCKFGWDDDAGEWANAESGNPYSAECPECDGVIEIQVDWEPVFYVSKPRGR
jgi:hypothetical protein